MRWYKNTKIWIFFLLVIFLLVIAGISILRVSLRKSHPEQTDIRSSFIDNRNKLVDFYKYQNDKLNKIEYPILYINMDKHTDRRKFMEDQFVKFGIENWERVQAIDGNNVSPVQVAAKYDLSPGEIGCTMSHMKAAMIAYKKGYEIVVTMEDDCSLDLMPLWERTLKEYIADAPDDWEIIQLTNQECLSKIGMSGLSPHDTTSPCYSNVCCVINQKGMEKILQFYYNGKFWLHGSWNQGTADSIIFEACNTYTLNTPLVFPYNANLESTLHSNHTAGHMKKSNTIIQYYLRLHKKRMDTQNKQNMFTTALLDMVNHLESRNIRFFLVFGTALGAARDGRFIDHDGDIDLAVFRENYDSSIESIENTKEFVLHQRLGNPETGYELRFEHVETGVTIDINIIYKEKDRFWTPSFNGVCDKSRTKMCRWGYRPFDLTEILFLGRKFLIPNPIEQFLEDNYGPTWMIPKKFGYHDGIENSHYRGLILDDFDSSPVKNPPKDKTDTLQHRIPKIIHQTWKRETNLPMEYVCCMTSVKKQHPSWTHKFWDDEKMEIFVATEFPEYYPTWKKFDKNIKRFDTARYMWLYRYGGMYVDMDVEFYTPIDHLLLDVQVADICIPGGLSDDSFSPALMISIPGHDLWLEMLKYAATNKDKNVLECSGPTALGKVVKRYKIVNPDHRIHVFDQDLLGWGETTCLGSDPIPGKIAAHHNSTPAELHWSREYS